MATPTPAATMLSITSTAPVSTATTGARSAARNQSSVMRRTL